MTAKEARAKISNDFNNGLIDREIAMHRHNRISKIGQMRRSSTQKQSLYKAVAIGE